MSAASLEKNALSVAHLISIRDLQASDLDLIFHYSDQFREVLSRPIKKVPSLRDMTIAVNGRPRETWADMLHDCDAMRSQYGTGVVEISTSRGGLVLDHSALRELIEA